MSKEKLVNSVAGAIQSADNSYFNENYTKQALAALAAVEKAGFVIMPKTAPQDVWEKAANAMKTGRVKPEEHVKNVYETVVGLLAVK